MACKGYLIHPETKSMEVVDVGDWRHMNQLIGSRTFTIGHHFDNGDVIYVDEGLLKPGLLSFQVRRAPQPLFGKGLVLGTNDEGDSVDPVTAYVDTLELIRFDPQFQTRSAS